MVALDCKWVEGNVSVPPHLNNDKLEQGSERGPPSLAAVNSSQSQSRERESSSLEAPLLWS